MTKHLLFLLLACAVTASSPPLWSWATLPLFHHSAKLPGDYNSTQLAALSRYPLVIIEKYQAVGSNDSRSEEDRILAACRGVKAANASVCCVAYLNTVISFPQYAYSQALRGRPDLWLRADDGAPINMSGPGWPAHVPAFPVLDYSLPAARAYLVAVCAAAVATGAVDGCFLDREVDTGAIPIPADKLAAYAAGHAQLAHDMQAAVGRGPVIANHMTSAAAAIPGVRGCMFEDFGGTQADLAGLLWAGAQGLVCSDGPMVLAALRKRGLLAVEDAVVVESYAGWLHHLRQQQERREYLK